MFFPALTSDKRPSTRAKTQLGKLLFESAVREETPPNLLIWLFIFEINCKSKIWLLSFGKHRYGRSQMGLASR